MGHEQAGGRPAVIVSNDTFNHGPAGLVVLVPMTTRFRRMPLRIEVNPPEGGLRERSFALCEAVRSVSTERLSERLGELSSETLAAIEYGLAVLLDL